MAPDWRECLRFSSRLSIMYRGEGSHWAFAPLYVHTFPVVAAEIAGVKYEGLKARQRLRYLRLQSGLIQKQVAQQVGVSESAYVDMELGKCGHFSAQVADKLAALFQVPVEDLLDGYNLFLHRGQERQLRECRCALGLSRKEFAALAGVGESSLKAWETGKKAVSRGCWEKLMKVWKKNIM